MFDGWTFGLVSTNPVVLHIPWLVDLLWFLPVLGMVAVYLVVLLILRLLRGT